MEDKKSDGPGPQIVFDVGEERRRPANYVDANRLIQMMQHGSEPYNVGNGWHIEEPDPNGLGATLTLEDSVIQQVRAYGKAYMERSSRGMILKFCGF